MSIFKPRQKQPEYSPEQYTPVIRVSICTGEKVAGFKDRSTGQIKEIMLIRSDRDIQAFREKYDIKDEKIEKIY